MYKMIQNVHVCLFTHTFSTRFIHNLNVFLFQSISEDKLTCRKTRFLVPSVPFQLSANQQCCACGLLTCHVHAWSLKFMMKWQNAASSD